MSDRSVLIVEDDPTVSSAIHAALVRDGCQARTAATCSAGLELALEKMPNLLVMDIDLPDGTGWGLLETIRRARPEDDLPVVVITSNEVSRAQLREHQVHRYVPKPFDMAFLIQTVRYALTP